MLKRRNNNELEIIAEDEINNKWYVLKNAYAKKRDDNDYNVFFPHNSYMGFNSNIDEESKQQIERKFHKEKLEWIEKEYLNMDASVLNNYFLYQKKLEWIENSNLDFESKIKEIINCFLNIFDEVKIQKGQFNRNLPGGYDATIIKYNFTLVDKINFLIIEVSYVSSCPINGELALE